MTTFPDNSSLVSIVLPIRNQADHVATVLKDYLAVLERAAVNFELLPVVNGTQHDISLERCQEVAAANPRVRVHVTEKGGWGWAVRHGLELSRGDYLCYTNSARTKAEDLLLLLLYARAYPGVVVKANRKIRASARRRLGSVLYNFECRALFDLASWDVNGTPKVFPRTFSHLLNLTRDDDLIDLEFATVCARERYPLVEVPIVSTVRHGGRSTTNMRSAFRMFLGALRMFQNTGDR